MHIRVATKPLRNFATTFQWDEHESRMMGVLEQFHGPQTKILER